MRHDELDEITEVPFDRSYWVDEEKLLAGCYPGDEDAETAERKLTYLLRYGITNIIDLMEDGEKNHSGKKFVTYHDRLKEIAKKMKREITFSGHPIKDLGIPSSEKMIEILDEIDANLLKNKRVYIHCWGGIGRTGTVVGCYLIRHGLATSDNVLDVIKELRAKTVKSFIPSPETELQRKMVKSWKSGT